MQIGSLHFVIALVAGWLQREQGAVLEYLKEENKVLREHLGDKRLLFTDPQRRRLARKGKLVGRRGLVNLGCIVTPDTILRWYRQLVAAKYDCSKRRAPGRPRTSDDVLFENKIDQRYWRHRRVGGGTSWRQFFTIDLERLGPKRPIALI